MNRVDVINNLIEGNDYKSYLEIGVDKGVSFDRVKCAQKTGVDPNPKSKATNIVTSDEFFMTNFDTFDIAFIDGLHHKEQCFADIKNALECLSDHGVVVVHDLLPTSKLMQTVPRLSKEWTGDVWKAWMEFRALPNLYMEVYDFDHGVGVIYPDCGQYALAASEIDISFSKWQKQRDYLMNVVPYKDRLIR